MRHFIHAICASAALCLLTVRPSYGEPETNDRVIDSNFTLRPLMIRKGRTFTTTPRKRSEIVRGREFTVAIVASWCPHSKELMHDVAGGNPAFTPDLFVFLDYEIDRLAPKLVKLGQDREAVNEWLAEHHRAHDIVAAPEDIEPRLLYYVVSGKQFKWVNEHPTLLVCDDTQCRVLE